MKFPLWGSGQKKLDVNAAYANEMAPFLTPGATYTRWNENTKRMEPVDVDAIGRQKMADLQRVRASQDSFDKKMKFFQGAAYAIPAAGVALSALGAGGATGGLGMANTGAWTTSVGAAPGTVGGVLPSTSLIPGALQTPTGGKMGFSLGNLFKGFTGRDKATLGVGGLNAVLDYRGKGNQLSADERALEYQRKSDAEMRALLAAQRDEDYQRELIKEAALQKRFDAEQLALQTRSDAQEKRLADQYNAREARMSPYREAGRTSLARIANIQAPTITPYTPSLVYRS